MRVVWECILIGLGLSFVAMGAAALGLVHPVAGAAIQEGIDLFVVLNALRARVDPHWGPQPGTPVDARVREFP